MSGLRYNWPEIIFWAVCLIVLVIGAIGILTMPPVEGVDY